MIERHTGNRLHGLSSRKLLPALHDLVAVDRVELDKARLPVGPFASDKSRAAAAKAVEDEITAAGAVAERTVPPLYRRIGSFARSLTACEARNYFRHAGYA